MIQDHSCILKGLIRLFDSPRACNRLGSACSDELFKQEHAGGILPKEDQDRANAQTVSAYAAVRAKQQSAREVYCGVEAQR